MSKQGTSTVLIQQLLTAEEEAERIVARARESKITLYRMDDCLS